MSVEEEKPEIKSSLRWAAFGLVGVSLVVVEFCMPWVWPRSRYSPGRDPQLRLRSYREILFGAHALLAYVACQPRASGQAAGVLLAGGVLVVFGTPVEYLSGLPRAAATLLLGAAAVLCFAAGGAPEDDSPPAAPPDL